MKRRVLIKASTTKNTAQPKKKKKQKKKKSDGGEQIPTKKDACITGKRAGRQKWL